MKKRLTVIVSSTVRDLPEHRMHVLDACLRQGMFPLMMEHVPATPIDAIQASLALVDDADIYIGVFAHRYGYIPKGSATSITEIEYQRARERGIPCLLFVMNDDHPIRISDVDTGDNRERIEALKQRLAKEQVVGFFCSPTELRAQVIDALSRYRIPTMEAEGNSPTIPLPPQAFVAHPYTLMQTRSLVGRRDEARLLSEWAAMTDTPIMIVVALGGMGKSALTWNWFNIDHSHRAGRLWWGFYEADASMEAFLVNSVAYVTGQAPDLLRSRSPHELEQELFHALNSKPFLLVLDGLERILVAYAQLDPAQLQDSEIERTTSASGDVSQSEILDHNYAVIRSLRRTSDPRVGVFLQKLTQVQHTKILISSRLIPAELENATGAPSPGVSTLRLQGLDDKDAVQMWKAFGTKESDADVLPILQLAGKHPLVIQALAGEVAHYRRAPGDFDEWLSDHSDFVPSRLPLIQVRNHILRFAVEGLPGDTRELLQLIAAFRMPCLYETLVDLTVRKPVMTVSTMRRSRGRGNPISGGGLFASERDVDDALSNLEDRGLLGWNRDANTYDLHPLVRGSTWANTALETKHQIYNRLYRYFDSKAGAAPSSRPKIRINDAVELINALVGLDQWHYALQIYRDSIVLSDLEKSLPPYQRLELLEMFLSKDDTRPLVEGGAQPFLWNELARNYSMTGQVKRAAEITLLLDKCTRGTDNTTQRIAKTNASLALMLAGQLRLAEELMRKAVDLTQFEGRYEEGVANEKLATLLAIRGDEAGARRVVAAAQHSFRLAGVAEDRRPLNPRLAFYFHALSSPEIALRLLDVAVAFYRSNGGQAVLVQSLRFRGSLRVSRSDYVGAREDLHESLARAREGQLMEDELGSMVGLATLDLK